MKCFYPLFLLLFFNLINAQTKSEIQIDGYLGKSLKAFSELKYESSLKDAHTALQLSEKSGNSKGVTLANIYIAKVLIETGFYKDGIIYLQKMEKEPYYLKSAVSKAENSRLRGRAYANLKMYDLAIDEFNNQLQYSKKIGDSYKRNLSILWTHQNLVHAFNLSNQRDSVWNHLISAEKILKNLKEEESFYDLSTTYAQVGNEYIKIKNFVQAKTYLDKSMALLKKYNAPYLNFTLEKYGDLANAEGKKDSAVYYYQQALLNNKELKNAEGCRYIYKLLADYFIINHLDKQKTNEYLYQYKILSDSLDGKNKYATQLAIKQILDKNKNEKNSIENNYIYLIITLSVLCAIWLFYLYFKLKRRKSMAEKHKVIIREQQCLTEELSQKVSANKFNDLIVLAKNNCPEFLVLFKELFPDFIAKLKFLSPNIKSSELTFCAMTYLNFSTKDIAEYTFVTPRAVQIRKNRLRKKYNIPSEEDFNSWMRKLGNVQNSFISDPMLSEN